jgi:hypothetical protein
VNKLTGEAETFIVQTIRDEEGDHIVIKFVDKEGVKRLILSPKVANAIVRQRDSLSARARSNSSKAAMKERMAAGFVPTFQTKQKVNSGEKPPPFPIAVQGLTN